MVDKDIYPVLVIHGRTAVILKRVDMPVDEQLVPEMETHTAAGGSRYGNRPAGNKGRTARGLSHIRTLVLRCIHVCSEAPYAKIDNNRIVAGIVAVVPFIRTGARDIYPSDRGLFSSIRVRQCIGDSVLADLRQIQLTGICRHGTDLVIIGNVCHRVIRSPHSDFLLTFHSVNIELEVFVNRDFYGLKLDRLIHRGNRVGEVVSADFAPVDFGCIAEHRPDGFIPGNTCHRIRHHALDQAEIPDALDMVDQSPGFLFGALSGSRIIRVLSGR